MRRFLQSPLRVGLVLVAVVSCLVLRTTVTQAETPASAGEAQASASFSSLVTPNVNEVATVAGSPDCTTQTHLAKIAPPAVGVYQLSNGGAVAITNLTHWSFDWQIALPTIYGVDAGVVIVAAGPASTVYTYDTYDDWDVGLQAPDDPDSDLPYRIESITFCFDPKRR